VKIFVNVVVALVAPVVALVAHVVALAAPVVALVAPVVKIPDHKGHQGFHQGFHQGHNVVGLSSRPPPVTSHAFFVPEHLPLVQKAAFS